MTPMPLRVTSSTGSVGTSIPSPAGSTRGSLHRPRAPMAAASSVTGGYRGPCPPPGDGIHRYSHELFALDHDLDLEPGASREQLENEMDGHVLAQTCLVGTYGRP